LVQQYRAITQEQRSRTPTLLNAIGKLEVLAGDLEDAQQEFQTVTRLVADPHAKAEAHFNAYQAALERGDHDGALRELLGSVQLDAARFAPFPVGKFAPQRIVGAGGFGVAFLCKHQYMDGPVVVKALRLDDLGRTADAVFAEAQVLRRLDHPGIIRVQDCGYVDAANRGRPYLVMDYFAGEILEAYVARKGALKPSALVGVASGVAEALQAAHLQGVLHRDVKPANLLVRRASTGWEIKVIDFGLSLRQEASRQTLRSVAATRTTATAASLGGTLDYSAPEQLGRRPGAVVDARADVYAFGRTCCFALFGTPQPSFQHWRQAPEGLAELLGRCVMEDPGQRPADFGQVLQRLASLRSGSAPQAPRSALPVAQLVSRTPAAPRKNGGKQTLETDPERPSFALTLQRAA
jgi:serine/threonine protein kinase